MAQVTGSDFAMMEIISYEIYLLVIRIRMSRVLRGIAYNSSTRGNCADTKKSETTENCEAGKWGSTNVHTTAIIDDVSKENTEVENDKKVSFDNVTEKD